MAATQGSASAALPEGITHDDDGKHTSDCVGVMRQLGASALEEHDYVFAESGLQKREVARQEVELNLRETELRIGPPSAAAAAAAATTKDGGTAPPTTLMSDPMQRNEIQMSDADILKEGTKFADPRLRRDSAEVKKSILVNTISAEKAAAKEGETTVFPHYHKVQLPSSFSSWDARVEQAGGSFGPFKSPRAHTVLKAHADHVSKPTLNLWLSHSKTAAQMLPSTGESTDVEQAKQNSSRDEAKRGPVGWPPVQSFRKNSLPASHSKNAATREDKPVSGSLAAAHAAISNSSHPSLVKVCMDGLGIGRKVDLKIHNSYHKLSATLEEMFQRFLNASHQVVGQKPVMKNPTYCGREKLNFLCGSEYVITYEDKDGDLMLMGDVPWGIFEETVKRLRIMKGYEAIGLAPRAPEKSRNRN